MYKFNVTNEILKKKKKKMNDVDCKQKIESETEKKRKVNATGMQICTDGMTWR